jgi:hypothetical protein
MCKRFLVGVLIALNSVPAWALINIDFAAISGGELRVVGRLSSPAEATVTLDDRYETRTDASGRFSFRVAYHPATCIVAVKSGHETPQVVVAGCAQRGPGEPSTTMPPQPPMLRLVVHRCSAGTSCEAKCGDDEFVVTGACRSIDTLFMEDAGASCVSPVERWARRG